MDNLFELKRDFETPLSFYHKGHRNDVKTWSRLFGITELEFYEYLEDGYFKNWLKIIAT